MKILEFIDGFNFEAFGGAGRVFIETAKVLSSQGHQIDVICRNDQTGDYANPYGIKFHHYDCRRFWFFQKYYNRRNSIRNLTEAYLGEIKPDLVIIHSSSAVLGIVSILERIPAKKLYVFHSPWCEEHRVNGNEIFPFDRILYAVRRKRELEALRCCDGIVTLSKYMQKLMLQIHPAISGKSMAVIPGGADLEKFSPASDGNEKMVCRRKFGIPERSFVLMTSRRLIPRTGVDVLIRAFAKAKNNSGRDMKLVIVGTGILFDELKALSVGLGLENDVIFTGFVDEDLLPSYYRASDLFVMPTRELEGFGLSTVETMACGVPAIGTDVGGTPEILSGISWDLVIKGCSEEAIARKIEKYSTQDAIAGLCEKSAVCVKDTFNWKEHTHRLIEFVTKMDQE